MKRFLTTLLFLLLSLLGLAQPLRRGVNISPLEGGKTVAQVRAYWPDSDLAILRGAGFDHVRIFVSWSDGLSSIPGVRDLITRADAQGERPCIVFRFTDGDHNPRIPDCITWWTTLFRNWTPPASLIIDPCNEPKSLCSDAVWQLKVQPEIYATLRKLAPHQVILLHAGGYEDIGAYAPNGPGPQISLPTDPAERALVWIASHEYHVADPGHDQGGDDAYNVGAFKAWCAARGVGAILTEFGGPDSYPWSDWVSLIASKSRAYEKLGVPACLWMSKQLFQSDKPGRRVLRPEVLLAIFWAGYQMPTRTDSTVKQPAGSELPKLVGG